MTWCTIIVDCPGIKVRTITGKLRCYTIIGGNQTLSDRDFTYPDAKLTCLSIDGILPVVKNNWDQNYILEVVGRYDLSAVRLDRTIDNMHQYIYIKFTNHNRIIYFFFLFSESGEIFCRSKIKYWKWNLEWWWFTWY